MNNVSSSQYSSLATRSLSAIADLNALARRVDRLIEDARELSVFPGTAADQTEMQMLGQIAANATEKAHDLQKKEAMENIQAVQRGERSIQPQSWLGRKLSGLANIAG